MTTEYTPSGGLFPVTVPDDADSPNGPAQFRGLHDDLDPLLRRAGAQTKKSIISAEQSTSSASYALLGTPDRVQSLVVPADALIFVAFWALWKESVAGAGRAAVYLGNGPLSVAEGGLNTWHDTPTNGLNADKYRPLYTLPSGLRGDDGSSGTDAPAATSNGQILQGGLITAFAAAPATYEVSVRFKTSSGSVSAKNRYLYVWTKEFV